MPILNYTTKIKAEKTAGEIQSILGKAGAQAVMSEYEDGEVTAISFKYAMAGELLCFRLPINANGVYRALVRTASQRYVNDDQAKRTAWRVIKDWVEAQMALVEANQADVVEVFLPFMQIEDGSTLYKRLESNNFRGLTYQPGEPHG